MVLLITWLSVAAQRTNDVRSDRTVRGCTGARRLVVDSIVIVMLADHDEGLEMCGEQL